MSSLILAGCSDRPAVPVVPVANDVGTRLDVFGASSRQVRPDGSFGFERSRKLTFEQLEIVIPSNRAPGTLSINSENPDPKRNFILASQTILNDSQEFQRRLRGHLAQKPTGEREVTVFVHGFNNTHVESAFRSAQLKHDINVPGAVIYYSWPSRGAPLGYAYDEDSVLFARDGLEQLLTSVRAASDRPIVLVAHSLGSHLTMETLRQIEIKSPGWAGRNLDSLVLMSPDLDVDLFRTQLSRFETIPQPFVIFANGRDRALGISQRLRGTHNRERLGNINSLDRLAGLPVQVIDTTGLKRSRDLNHFPAANSPTLITLLGRLQEHSSNLSNGHVELADILPGVVTTQGETVHVKLATPSGVPQ